MDVQNNGKQITYPVFPAKAISSNDSRKFFVLQGEHQQKWTAENPNNRIGICLKIDGFLIDDNQVKKCDRGLLLDDNRLFLVELKGKGYDDAVKQLVRTKKIFQDNYSDYDLIFHARIVGKSFPKASTELQTAKRNLKMNFNDNYRLFEKSGVERI